VSACNGGDAPHPIGAGAPAGRRPLFRRAARRYTSAANPRDRAP